MLKLTTDKHEASHGLSATAELRVNTASARAELFNSGLFLSEGSACMSYLKL